MINNKLQGWERDRKYREHVQRMRHLSSPLRRNRSRDDPERPGASQPDLGHFRGSQTNEQLRRMNMENERLMKKLSQIGRRKNKFVLQSREEKNYFTINLRSREASRLRKVTEIEQENYQIVERIVRMRSKGPSPHSSTDDLTRKKKPKRRSSRNPSVVLPKIEATA